MTIRRDNAQRRRAGSRKPKDRVLVVVCGARTEKLCYDKTKLDFAVFAPGITDAIDRGRRLSESGRDHRHNPSTTMWRLAATIVGG